MTAQPAGHGEGSSLAAAVGWGGIVLFGILFVWFITRQLSDEWENREAEAVRLVRQLQPGGGPTVEDRTRAMMHRKQSEVFVGLFHWEGRQVNGPQYHVKLTWKEAEAHKEALWRVDLESGEVEAADVAAAEMMESGGARSAVGGGGGPRE